MKAHHKLTVLGVTLLILVVSTAALVSQIQFNQQEQTFIKKYKF
ncbi:hypothetical protein SIN07_08395 [Pediococcus inopinatus]|uniref:Uncharacterized protein n=1 Tax=Pediococcus inopinatus TaxID=114090 RepID=A0ABZ0Q5T6_9LACO|nr:hypothetical protein [Pediococcus inopinatus]WPC20345.1 hypothetical protein N6G95_03940 [Pediococcus inopinatus]WPC22049.1 hypothetical protein N6G96_02195 [Pediococcus inopinatus]WPP09019.1 hypothetical protein SIN07_08395 [Pediococcus inopinatus]